MFDEFTDTHTYTNQNQPGCYIVYQIQNTHREDSQDANVYIEDFHCTNAKKGNGRRLLLSFLRKLKRTYSNIQTVSLISSPYTDVPNPDFMANRPKYQKQLDNYYNSLGFNRDTSMDIDEETGNNMYEEGDASLMFSNIDTIINTIKNFEKTKKQKGGKRNNGTFKNKHSKSK